MICRNVGCVSRRTGVPRVTTMGTGRSTCQPRHGAKARCQPSSSGESVLNGSYAGHTATNAGAAFTGELGPYPHGRRRHRPADAPGRPPGRRHRRPDPWYRTPRSRGCVCVCAFWGRFSSGSGLDAGTGRATPADEPPSPRRPPLPPALSRVRTSCQSLCQRQFQCPQL